LTQAEYDAIAVPTASTIYIITPWSYQMLQIW
jgi:hypothetical protein